MDGPGLNASVTTPEPVVTPTPIRGVGARVQPLGERPSVPWLS